MNTTCNILIIEDHQIIIDAYINAFKSIETNSQNSVFNIEQAKNCDSAYKKIKKASANKGFDLIFLDIQLPQSICNKFQSGEDLGLIIKELLPNARIIVCTSCSESFRLNNIIKSINPCGFLIKSDITYKDIINCIEDVLANKTYYSHTVINLLRNRTAIGIVVDDYDVSILRELANGSKMKELLEIIPLSKAGIEKRKRLLKLAFNTETDSDRELVLTAREKGFI